MLADDDMMVNMLAKEDQLEGLFKLTSKARSVFESKTAEMVELLHKTRDEQVSCDNQSAYDNAVCLYHPRMVVKRESTSSSEL